MIKKPQIELTIKNTNGGEQVVYPYVEADHVTLENGMLIEEVIEKDIIAPNVIHQEKSFKVGTGDQDVSNSIVDSTVGKMVIKGQTYQNILPEPSTHIISNNKESFKVNEGVNENIEFVDGVAKSAILKGQTLVNMVLNPTQEYVLQQDGSGIKGANYSLIDGFEDDSYTVMFEASNVNLVNTDNPRVVYINTCSEEDKGADNTTIKSFIKNGKVVVLYNPSRKKKTTKDININLHTDSGVGSTITIKNLVILKGDYTNIANDIPFFEGMQSVKMPVLTTVGKNLFDVHKVVEESTNKVSVTKNNETITITSISERGACYRDLDNIPLHLKANVRYTLSSNYAIAGNGQPYMRFYEVLDSGTRKTISATHKDDGSKIIKECTLTKDTIVYVGLYVATGTDGKLGSSVSYYNIQLEESEATSYEPFKSNILSCQPTPLSQSMFEQGSFSESTPYNTQPYENVKLNSGQHYVTRIRVKDTCKVVGGETYGVQLNEGYGIFICYCKNGLYSNTENKWIDMTNFTFTVPKDCDEMFFALRKTDNTQINTSEYPLIGLKIHQDITLRGIGDVRDELNLLTGELTQRIGEIVLDGSEVEWKMSSGGEGYVMTHTASKSYSKIIADTYPVITGFGKGNGIFKGNGAIAIVNSDYSDVGSFKTWLSQNPITIQYQLAKESIKTVDLTTSGNWNKIVLNGSESWDSSDSSMSLTHRFVCYGNTNDRQHGVENIICDNMRVKNVYNLDEEGILGSQGGTQLYLRVLKSKLPTTGVNGLKQYLQQNPITVWYQTETHKDSTNVKQPIFFKDGYITQSSGADNSLIPTLDYQAKTKNSYVMDLMKTGTTYTMKASSISGTATIGNAGAFTLNANRTFTSPASQSLFDNKLLVIKGSATDLMIIEGDVTSKTIPYFKGIKSAFEGEDKIEVLSTSQNILDTSKIVQGDLLGSGIIGATGGSADLYCYTEDFIPCPNIKHPLYVHRTIDGVYSSSTYYIFFFDEDKRLLQPRTVSNTFTIPDGAKYLRIMVHKGNVDVSRVGIMVTNSGADRFNQSVGGLQNNTKIPLLSPLRSLPNGVCDELIIDRTKSKATLIQRVGKVVLNGGENWTQSQIRDKHYVVMLNRCSEVGIPEKYPSTLLCSHFINQQPYAYDREGINIHVNYNFHIGFLKNRLSEVSVGSCKKWLSQNPVTVYYELATPVITGVDLENFPYIYKDGHIFLNSEIAPTTEITYSICQQHQIESSNEDLIRHEQEISYLYQLIAQYVQVDYQSTLLALNLEIN